MRYFFQDKFDIHFYLKTLAQNITAKIVAVNKKNPTAITYNEKYLNIIKPIIYISKNKPDTDKLISSELMYSILLVSIDLHIVSSFILITTDSKLSELKYNGS